MHPKFRIREANSNDAPTIGTLHATSWMIAYRGLLSDEYLDNDLIGERQKYWVGKMPLLSPKEFVLLAESDDGVIGFVAVMDLPEKGYHALVDNLHVRPDLKGNGVGGELLKAAARKAMTYGNTNFYLWVLNGNVAAEKFYLSKHAKACDQKTSDFGGKVVTATRFVWDDFDKLLK